MAKHKNETPSDTSNASEGAAPAAEEKEFAITIRLPRLAYRKLRLAAIENDEKSAASLARKVVEAFLSE